MANRRWHRDPDVRAVLDDGELLQVAVAARRGPHVTPTVFSAKGEQVWFVVPRGSVKARVIKKRPHIGALVRAGDRAVVMRGRARLVDPLTVRGMRSLVDVPFAATRFIGRNLRDTAGVVTGRPAPTLAIARVGVECDVTAVALIDGDEVVAEWGTWPEDPPDVDDVPVPAPDLAAVPAGLRELVAPGTSVTLGWSSPSGPLALPARWQGTAAEISPAVLRLAGPAASGPACLTWARTGSRLDDKRGVLVRGEGHVQRDGVAVAAARVVWWHGDEIGAA